MAVLDADQINQRGIEEVLAGEAQVAEALLGALAAQPSTDIFISSPGSVMQGSVSEKDKVLTITITADRGGGNNNVVFSSNEGAFGTMASVVTGINLNEECNVQFMPSLRNTHYIYTFGEKIGQMSVSGICFLVGCANSATAAATTGFHRVYEFYQAYRISTYNYPLTLTLTSVGGKTVVFKCFLCSLNQSITDPRQMLGSFNLTMYYIQDKTTNQV